MPTRLIFLVSLSWWGNLERDKMEKYTLSLKENNCLIWVLCSFLLTAIPVLLWNFIIIIFSVLSSLIVSGIGSGPSICLENLKQISILLNRFPNQLKLHFRFIIERVNHTTLAAHPLHVLSKPWVYPHHIHIWSSLCSASLVFCHGRGCPGPAGECHELSFPVLFPNLTLK